MDSVGSQYFDWRMSKCSPPNNPNSSDVVSSNYFKNCILQCGENYVLMPDFNVIATLELCPEEAEEELTCVDEDPERQAELLQDMKQRQLVRSVRNQIKRSSTQNNGYWELEEKNSEDQDVYKIVWEKPYTSPASVLKKPNMSVEAKPNRTVLITPPPSHKSGYNPVRTQGGGVYLRKRDKKYFTKKIRQNAEQYLFDAVLAPAIYNDNDNVKPICPLSKGIIIFPCTRVDFVIVVNSGPEDFFVRIGQLDMRRRFNYMEQEMKLWYTKKKGLMEYCATTLQEAEYLGFYVMYYGRFGEFVRVQISSPVEYDFNKNPSGIVTIALIDYGGHLYARVRQLLPLMPYFALFPKMAFRGVLSLTRNLERNTGRTTYTDNQEKVFRNLIADYNGIVEAFVAAPEDSDDLKKYDDNETFSTVELVLYVMSNGKLKTVDEILLSEEQHNVYLREPSHYPSVEEFREQREDSLSPVLGNCTRRRIVRY